jgi:hypothetical protein
MRDHFTSRHIKLLHFPNLHHIKITYLLDVTPCSLITVSWIFVGAFTFTPERMVSSLTSCISTGDAIFNKTVFFFYIFCWPYISVRFLPMTNLTHFFNVFIYLTSLHLSNSTVFIIMRSIVLTRHLVCIGLSRWLLGMPDRHTKHSPT